MKDMNCTNETIFLIIALLFAGVFIVLRHLYAERHPRCIHCGKRSRRKNWRPVNYYKSKNSGIFFDISISLPTFAVSIKLITLKLKCYGKLARISF